MFQEEVQQSSDPGGKTDKIYNVYYTYICKLVHDDDCNDYDDDDGDDQAYVDKE